MLRKLFSLSLALVALIFATTAFSQHATNIKLDLQVNGKGVAVKPTMWGIFFEDINFSADGGLYAELIKNRSFEFPNALVGWLPFGSVKIDSVSPAFPRNPHYAHIQTADQLTGSGLYNEGFKGIGLKKDEEYRFTFFARTPSAKPLKVEVAFYGANQEKVAAREVELSGNSWTKYTVVIRSPLTDMHAGFRFRLLTKGAIDVDHLSLFPLKTWKGRENGLRADLAQALADLKPGVFRFPGGCIVEGTTLETRYQWKNTVGPVENRPLNINRWNYTMAGRFFPDYFQSYGLGFYEYFTLCEDIGAQPLPVISCGMACQFEKRPHAALDKLDPFIQDALDLVEFANGAATTKWGKIRAEMGHPEPFRLKKLGVGNEQWGTEYIEHLQPFVAALRDKYPALEIVGSSGPNPDGDKFEFLWPEMKKMKADLVDEHYYKSPEWFFSNAARYDQYDRKGPKVFAGEYAAHDQSSGKKNSFLTALSEAAFMTGLERNADVVHMTAYAPLFAHVDAWQWKPDLIWYDNLTTVLTPNYYVQQLFSRNTGNRTVPLLLNGKPLTGQENLFASATVDDASGTCILKLVNSGKQINTTDIAIAGLKKGMPANAPVSWTLINAALGSENTVSKPDQVKPFQKQAELKTGTLTVSLPAESVNIFTIKITP